MREGRDTIWLINGDSLVVEPDSSRALAERSKLYNALRSSSIIDSGAKNLRMRNVPTSLRLED